MGQIQYSNRHLQESDLLALLPWVPSGPVCDIGCGQGELASQIGAYGLPTSAVDSDSDSIHMNKQRYSSPVEWVHSDIRNYRLQRDSYAALFCLNVFPYIPNGERARLIGRFKAAIKPGGLLVISGLLQSDPLAQARLASSSNRISVMPTGVFQSKELAERLHDWTILFVYEGPAWQSYGKETRLYQICQIIAQKSAEKNQTNWQNLVPVGLGVALQTERNAHSLLESKADFVEVPIDDFLEPEDDAYLAQLSQLYRWIPACKYLSIGTPDWTQHMPIRSLKRVLARSQHPWWNISLAYNHTEQSHSFGLHVLPCTEESLETVKSNIRYLRQWLDLPIVLDSLSYVSYSEASEMDVMTFLRHLVLEADCGLLIDLDLFWKQTSDSDVEPISWLERLPKERIIQIRCSLINHPVFESLVHYTLKHCNIKAITLQSPDYEDPAELLQKARETWGFNLK